MKKLLSLILAAAAMLAMSTAAFAETASSSSNSATITFDTEKALDYVHAFGNADQTGLAMTFEESDAILGKTMRLSENFKESVSNRYGGFYVDAADFGVENFSGYTMKMSIKVTEQAAKATPSLEIFSDGEQWISLPIQTEDYAGVWKNVTLTVPANVNNQKLGLSIPITEAYSGDVAFIDELYLTDNYGKVIANIGDIDTSVAQAPNSAMSILTTILFVLLVIAAVLGVGYMIMKNLWKYR